MHQINWNDEEAKDDLRYAVAYGRVNVQGELTDDEIAQVLREEAQKIDGKNLMYDWFTLMVVFTAGMIVGVGVTL